MRPLDSRTLLNGPTIATDITIEEAVRILASAPEGDIAVVDPAGKAVGFVTFRQLAVAMVNSHESGHRAVA